MNLTDCQCWKELIPEYFLWGMAFIALYYILKHIDFLLTEDTELRHKLILQNFLKGGKENEESIQKE